MEGRKERTGRPQLPSHSLFNCRGLFIACKSASSTRALGQTATAGNPRSEIRAWPILMNINEVGHVGSQSQKLDCVLYCPWVVVNELGQGGSQRIDSVLYSFGAEAFPLGSSWSETAFSCCALFSRPWRETSETALCCSAWNLKPEAVHNCGTQQYRNVNRTDLLSSSFVIARPLWRLTTLTSTAMPGCRHVFLCAYNSTSPSMSWPFVT